MRLKTTLITTMTALSLALAGTAYAEKVMRLHHLNNDDPFDNGSGAMATVFKSLVESGTNGSVTVESYPNGQLGDDAQVLSQLRAGVVQSGIHSVGGFASAYPMIGVLDVPFAFPDVSTTYEVFDGPFGDKLAADIEEKTGLKVLGFGDSGGLFAITNSRREVRSPEDMEGLQIRTMGLDTHQEVIRSLGGQPTAIAWSEVYTALQTGVADGQMNPIPIISFARFDEVQDYLTLTNHLFAPYVWVVSDQFWNSLDEHEQSVVKSAARSAIVAGRGISRIIESSERGLPHLSANMEVHALTPEEMEAFREASQPAVKEIIAEKYGAEGEEMLNAFLEAIEEASQ
ncbi:DctP family TRAP transporter solute-binding subunit [Billgrantia kenyensis]|uniref:DctP family TRAP transporter solute-binding subunit n=1 Tax=Billgrantia kenyensis TaxID=321266 RepID=A0A7W0AFW6_9GAMM|nr:DctP family TRAP transporter solute-binding subunit [Halomonas kenyensis]MBA2781014.1 DctP family TRAP transporter solute-binding subunit [Halomonas kenyensis]MCG6663761.1 DctP family TRAP transporter solute-binding subunit [Halomonas kenyensis]